MNEGQLDEYVLIVDDDIDVREALTEIMSDRECSVRAAGNGKEALDIIRGGPGRPCVILLDLMMPVMDGKTFYGEVAKDSELRDIPIVILSAHANMDQMLSDVAVAAKLRKPVQIAPLLNLVSTHCSGSAARQSRSLPS